MPPPVHVVHDDFFTKRLMPLFGVYTSCAACLRCQLRNVLLDLRRRPILEPLTTRGLGNFGSSSVKTQEATQPLLKDQNEREIREHLIRHVVHGDDIVGKRGRRQRASAVQLPTDSLGRPARVIIMRDIDGEGNDGNFAVADTEATEFDLDEGEAIMRPPNMEPAVLASQKEPQQAEVNTSIDALRPLTRILEEDSIDALRKTLHDGYNAQQLTQYLSYAQTQDSSQRLTAGETNRVGDAEEILITPWQPGQTPLEQRRDSVSGVKQIDAGTTKQKVIDQILRHAWHLSSSSEEQKIGELELRLKPWQISLLFPEGNESPSALKKFINSEYLLRASDIKPYRPKNVVRITGRRQDANDVASKIDENFRQVKRLEINIDLLGRYRGKKKRNGKEVRKDVLSKKDVASVAKVTAATIDCAESGNLTIYSLSERSIFTARRIVLGMLDLPSRMVTEWILPAEVPKNKQGEDETLLPSHEPAHAGCLSYHHRKNELFRLIGPVLKNSSHSIKPKVLAGDSIDPWQKIAQHITRRFEQISEPPSISPDTQDHIGQDSGWKEPVVGRWNAYLCLLLQRKHGRCRPIEHRQENKFDRDTEPYIQAHQVPLIASLLSYFAPRSPQLPIGDRNNGFASRHGFSSLRTLIVHLMPSPLTSRGAETLSTYPRVFVRFKDGLRGGVIVPQLSFVSALLSEQRLHVPFPTLAGDISFQRTVKMRAQYNRMRQDEWLQSFVRSVQQSLASPDGTLDALPQLDIPMPSCFMTKQKSDTNVGHTAAHPVTYLLDRFEQTEDVDFLPLPESQLPQEMDAELRTFLIQWPRDIVLRIREVEGGTFGGRRTELILLRKESRDSETIDDEGQREIDDMKPQEAFSKDRSLELTTTSIGLLKMVTRARRGELKPWHECAAFK